MKKMLIKEIIPSYNYIKKDKNINKLNFLLVLFLILLLGIINDYILITIYRKEKSKPIKLISKAENIVNNGYETNIDFKDEFFHLEEVKKQLNNYNLTYIETITGHGGNIGNGLISLNNLINICISIKCRNIITPEGGLSKIIKKPIFNKEFNINILPNSYQNLINIDINLNWMSVLLFKYTNKNNEMRLNIIRDEVLSNLPKYKADPMDLYIKIRSGDIFVKRTHRLYSQPPLCFYQKIINENKYNKIYILSNGHENPVVDELLKIYPNTKYMYGSLEYDISVIINAYNFVMSISTFPMTLIWLNNNIRNLYIYDMMDFNYLETINFNFRYANYAIHKMKPSLKYFKLMFKNWKNTTEQLDLMIKENCTNTSFSSFFPKYKKRKSVVNNIFH